jgi:hypothetical protein
LRERVDAGHAVLATVSAILGLTDRAADGVVALVRAMDHAQANFSGWRINPIQTAHIIFPPV